MRYSSPPDPKAFAEQVYAIARRIPAGKVATYGQISLMLLPPPGVDADQYRRAGAIWVGGAMAHAPDDVPWQRVINSQGKISPRPGIGPSVQRSLLEKEGVTFDAKDRVDLKRFGWRESGEEPAQPILF
jgi:methylated-DNA-protein-cysteine methyltransferase-like protein